MPVRVAGSDYVRAGDTVVVWKLDRLGRNTVHVLGPTSADGGHTDRRISALASAKVG
jgi:hypothetical protein